MSRLALLHRSTVGKKAILALSGLLLVAFVVAHLAANLLILAPGGVARVDAYARALHGMPVLLWGARAGLLAAAVVHVAIALDLARIQRAARPIDYRARRDRQASLASRTMLPTGLLLALFLPIHLANLTWGNLHPRFAPLAPGENLVALFRGPLTSAFYLVVLLALALHLGHGSRSLFQSLGVSPAGHAAVPRRLATALGLLIAAGFAAVVVAALSRRLG